MVKMLYNFLHVSVHKYYIGIIYLYTMNLQSFTQYSIREDVVSFFFFLS